MNALANTNHLISIENINTLLCSVRFDAESDMEAVA